MQGVSMIVRYRYMISKPDGTEYDGKYYSEAEAKYVYDRYGLQRQGFYIMKTYRVVKTKTDLINEIRMFDINTKVYKLWLMPKKKLERIVNKWKIK